MRPLSREAARPKLISALSSCRQVAFLDYPDKKVIKKSHNRGDMNRIPLNISLSFCHQRVWLFRFAHAICISLLRKMTLNFEFQIQASNGSIAGNGRA